MYFLLFHTIKRSSRPSQKYMSSHENKKPEVHFIIKIILIENECKTYYGCLTFIFYQNIFYDKMDLRLFYFRVTICSTLNTCLHLIRAIELSVYFCTKMRPSANKYNLALDILITTHLLILNPFFVKVNWKSNLEILTFIAASVFSGRQYTGMGTASWPGVSLAYVEGKLHPYACFLPSKRK